MVSKAEYLTSIQSFPPEDPLSTSFTSSLYPMTLTVAELPEIMESAIEKVQFEDDSNRRTCSSWGNHSSSNEGLGDEDIAIEDASALDVPLMLEGGSGYRSQ